MHLYMPADHYCPLPQLQPIYTKVLHVPYTMSVALAGHESSPGMKSRDHAASSVRGSSTARGSMIDAYERGRNISPSSIGMVSSNFNTELLPVFFV